MIAGWGRLLLKQRFQALRPEELEMPVLMRPRLSFGRSEAQREESWGLAASLRDATLIITQDREAL